MRDNNCEFCIEFETPKKSAFYRLFSKYNLSSRIIYETTSYVALAGLGALSDGYILLLPKKHYLSLASLPKDEIIEFELFKEEVTERIRSEYNNLICFEHGAVSSKIRAGCCIDHAHLHVCPCPIDLSPLIDILFKKQHLTRLWELNSFAKKKIPYLFYENQEGHMFTYLIEGELEPQFLRRLWAEALGLQDQWDWAVFIGEQNIIRTLKKLGEKINMRSKDDKVLTTVRSYDLAADKYNENTNRVSFFPGLKEELDLFISFLSGKKILDVGFGSGRDCVYFYENSLDPEGIELARNMIESLSKKLNIPLTLMDMRYLTYKDSSFDGIWCCASFLHLPREEALSTLKGFERVLKPNGILHLSVKEGEGEEWITKGNINNVPRFFTYYTVKEIQYLLRDAGFTVVSNKVKPNKDCRKPAWIVFLARKNGN